MGYTNEGMDLHAYTTLQRWLRATYPSLAGPTSSSSGETFLESLTNGFMEAARRGPGASISRLNRSIDPDVQIGLGVLFYNDAEYSKAVDCFMAALSVRPGDYRLWSRLGATLANSGRSEEAIDAYHKALEINPTFVRGRKFWSF